jgi:hypothetical protein
MGRSRKREPDWVSLRDDELLDLRLCDLKLRIPGTMLEDRIAQLHEELKNRGLRVKPHCWLAEEWFAPDGVPGIAVPFYLAHPRLMELERRQMLAVEGGTRDECLRILRHEAGHVVESAFRLYRRRSWQRIFGRASKRYPTHYRVRPSSDEYVLHLGSWYAQSHPSEDFAETFAVWLKPEGDWRRRYADWPALDKLEYVDELMHELAGAAPQVRSRRTVEPLSQVRTTLGEHYRRKQASYENELPVYFERAVRRLFAGRQGRGDDETATAFLRRHRRELAASVAQLLGVHPYVVDHLLQEMIRRAKKLGLRRRRSESRTRRTAEMMLTVLTKRFLRDGRHKLTL